MTQCLQADGLRSASDPFQAAITRDRKAQDLSDFGCFRQTVEFALKTRPRFVAPPNKMPNRSRQGIKFTEIIEDRPADSMLRESLELVTALGIEPIHGLDEPNDTRLDEVIEIYLRWTSMVHARGDQTHLRHVNEDQLFAVKSR
jgi:hypothetical protein